ncbi:RING finger protein 223-like [Mantella aurantiaca]
MATDPPNEPEPEENLRNTLECPICYISYDNIFKTPLLLPCSHTFCIECLSRLCLFLKKSQDFPCPLCRNLAQIPPEGVPKMQPNLEIVAQLPPEMQKLQEVWLAGYKLCSRRKKDSEEDKGSLMEIQLLSNDRQNSLDPDGLITIEQNGCRAFIRSVWGIGFTIFILGILLFTVVFLPIYINRQ